MSRRTLRLALVVALAGLGLAGCGGMNMSKLNPVSWFSGPEKPKPTPLKAPSGQLAVRAAWSARLPAVAFPLVVATPAGQFVAAGGDGTVAAFDAASGRELWRTAVGERLAAGVGSDGRFSAVVTRNNELVVLEGGAVKWRAPLASRVSSAPLVAGERVFVMGVDRAVHAFDALDGRRLWALQRATEALTLAQASVVTAFKDTLLVAQGPRLTAVDPLRGSVRWDVPLASPRGTNEVERLADLVGPAVRVGDTVCARAFQSAVGCADAERGRALWSRTTGGLTAVSGDAELLFGGDASDRVSAWRTASGEPAWSFDGLRHRDLSAPLATPRAVVVGDFEGQLHFLSRADGTVLQRQPTDGSAIVAAPVRAADGTVLAVTRNGGLHAFRIE